MQEEAEKRSMDDRLKEKLAQVSARPGVYLMKDGKGEIIYVGKAKSLKKRVASYFNRPAQADLKTGVLVSKIRDLDTIITASEQEALILESNLIKRHKPRYNVILKDGKRYHHILDPRTGRPAVGLSSVTVVAPKAELADGLATAAFVLGPRRGFDLVKKHAGVEALMVTTSGSVLITAGLQPRVKQRPPTRGGQ